MSEQLRAAAERTREHARYCDENRIDEGPYSEDATLQTIDESLLIDWAVERLAADEAAPQWHAKPTCAGLWYFPMHNLAKIILADETEWNINAEQCFGPIPNRIINQ